MTTLLPPPTNHRTVRFARPVPPPVPPSRTQPEIVALLVLSAGALVFSLIDLAILLYIGFHFAVLDAIMKGLSDLAQHKQQ